MKLWKKLLLAVGILAALGIGLLSYGVMKFEDVYTEKIKPDMQQYVQMNQEEQDKYIITNLEKLLKGIQSEDAKTDDKVKMDLEAVQKDEAVRQAGVAFGRSVCAHLINVSEDITKTLSPEDKAKYKKEADALEQRSQHLDDMVAKYTNKVQNK